MLHPRLTLAIFIAGVFHIIAKMISIIFDLRFFFADTKSFELESLHLQVHYQNIYTFICFLKLF